VKTKITLLALLAGWAMNAQTIKATTSTYGTASTFGNNSVLVGTSAGNAASTGANNTFVGYESGKVNTTGAGNAFLGYQTGKANITGSSNTFFGSESGLVNTASNNSFFGYQSGKANTSGTYNSFGGYKSGTLNTTGQYNVFLGSNSGGSNTTGSANVLLGYGANQANGTGSDNICIGKFSGSDSGDGNIFIGTQAGDLEISSHNIFIGNSSGSMLAEGTGNVFIGYTSGPNGDDMIVNNQLYLDNTPNNTPLIWGDFSADQLKLNGKTGIGMGTNTFPTSVGGASVTGYNLFVRGGILADEVRVRTTWSDYVFAKDYKLPTLEEVENHIKKNGYLLNVPSGKQVAEEGIEIGQMAKIQQEKIEELTLYIIEQNRINKEQGEKIAKLETLVQTLLDKQ
jgi:hypothetical protein